VAGHREALWCDPWRRVACHWLDFKLLVPNFNMGMTRTENELPWCAIKSLTMPPDALVLKPGEHKFHSRLVRSRPA